MTDLLALRIENLRKGVSPQLVSCLRETVDSHLYGDYLVSDYAGPVSGDNLAREHHRQA